MDTLKQALANLLLDELPKEGVIALGSGSTVNAIIEAIGARRTEFLNVKFLSASSLTSEKLRLQNIPEVKYHPLMTVELCIDGADQIRLKSPNFIIKGRGGALFREKLLWLRARKIWVTVTPEKWAERYTFTIPIEVDPFATEMVLHQLEELELFENPEFLVRKHQTGIPFYTDNGNIIIDIAYKRLSSDLRSIHHHLKQMSGVLETGIFSEFEGTPIFAYTIQENGKVEQKELSFH